MISSGHDRAELAAWCVAFVAEMLELAPSKIDPSVKFSRMGVDSAMSVQLAVALEERLGIALSPDVIADHPTISGLVDYLSRLPAKAASSRRGQSLRYGSLIDVLDSHAADQPSATAFAFLSDGGRADAKVTFAGLRGRALAIADEFAARGARPGDRWS